MVEITKFKKHSWVFFALGVLLFVAVKSCTSSHAEEDYLIEDTTPIDLDLEEIIARGYLRAVVENRSTSFYLYKGRRMGYEYELLKKFSESLDVGLRILVVDEVEEATRLLYAGKADIIAMNLTPTEERNERLAFSVPIAEMGPVLVQHGNTKRLRKVEDLAGRTVHVPAGTVHFEQLQQLRDTLALPFHIDAVASDRETLVARVVNQEIGYTVVDTDIASVQATYHADLQTALTLGDASPVSWGLRPNAPALLEALDDWLADARHSGYQAILYHKYFLDSRNAYFRSNSPFSSVGGQKISPYDQAIQQAADELGWDWRLLASLVYKESQFDNEAKSYAGALGLLQLMPVTLERFGVDNPLDPHESLMGGVQYLRYLDVFWKDKVPDSQERIKFILASYNIGHGHVLDAWRLALKNGARAYVWESVSYFLEQKSNPKYYRDPVVRSGFAKGHLAVRYVEEVLALFDAYRALVS
ncbi:lytic transglycosylase [Nitritalea halalkaliphila LW7]|uniref:Lytic transglycosylase n=1 Tax=Nitritalea halalkaliphila LW7 TaxID=1189621 RepID=I5BWD1_9BACT|nr:transporter substrate-binding domain-containing protein [Nitritalea halalkaliphila]EIM73883.1 lytic transglycosylase [Nitritalea halalkaliphila LW7]